MDRIRINNHSSSITELLAVNSGTMSTGMVTVPDQADLNFIWWMRDEIAGQYSRVLFVNFRGGYHSEALVKQVIGPKVCTVECHQRSLPFADHFEEVIAGPLQSVSVDTFLPGSFECIVVQKEGLSDSDLAGWLAVLRHWLSTDGVLVLDGCSHAHRPTSVDDPRLLALMNSLLRAGFSIASCFDRRCRVGVGEIGQWKDEAPENTDSISVRTMRLVKAEPRDLPLTTVIVSHPGSPADLPSVLSKLSTAITAPHEVIFVDENSKGLSDMAALNRLGANQIGLACCSSFLEAVTASRGQILIYVKSSVELPSNSLTELMFALLDDKRNAATGPTVKRPGLGNSSDDRKEIKEELFTSERSLTTTSRLSTICFAARREVVAAALTAYTPRTFPDAHFMLQMNQQAEASGGRLLTASHVCIADECTGDSPAAFVPTATDLVQPPVKRKPTLAVCLIVKNNEGTISDCLESIRTWVDELIVVDTGSTDNTKAICKEFSVKLFEFPWCDDFAAARNESLKHATTDWILWMDSDDVMPTSQGQKLKRLIASEHAPNCLGYVLQVNCPSGDGNMTVVDHVKVVRNHPKIRFEHRIHEQILPSIRRLGGVIAFTDIFVVHVGSHQSEAMHRKKLERDFRLLAMENAERPGHPFVLFNLGMTCENAGRYTEAVGYLEQCIDAAAPGESQLRKAWALLASSLQGLGKYEEAVAAVRRGLAAFPEDGELLFRYGMLMQTLERFEDAIDCYQSLLKIPQERTFRSVDPAVFGAKAHHNLAVAYAQAKRLHESIRHFKTAIEMMPLLKSAWVSLAEQFKTCGDMEQLGHLSNHPALQMPALRDVKEELAKSFSDVETLLHATAVKRTCLDLAQSLEG